MHVYEGDRLRSIQRLWKRYVLGNEEMGECPKELSPMIWQSWINSRNNGVNPLGTSDAVAERNQFYETLAHNRELLEDMIPYIESLYKNMVGSNYLFQVVSSNGFILKTITKDRKILDIIYDNDMSLLDGAVVTEEDIGTNSSGLCLKRKEPVETLGAEHYQKSNHRFACVSAPIFEGDALLGCLTLMCPMEDYQPFSFGLINATVDSIQKERQLKRAWKETSKSNHILRSVFQMQNDGMILMDHQYNIRYHNDKALEYLNLPKKSILGKSFYDLVMRETLPGALRKPNGGFPESPVSFCNSKGERCELTAELTMMQLGDEDKDYVLRYRPLKQTYSLVSTVGGYRAAYTFDSITGNSAAIRESVGQGMRAARSDSTVLIQGESGTGKELMAQSIHNASARANGPFIAINCGSIPKDLIASELFGYEAGAFTGADRHGSPGKFELADGGTIFLDEIGDMPFNLQVSLLRVLQDHEVSRLGSKTSRSINVRVIAATNRNLRKAITQGEFQRGSLLQTECSQYHAAAAS